MPWKCVLQNNRRWVLIWLLIFSSVCATEAVAARQAHLVTYGEGSQSWEWFGHNALWLQDPSIGLNHTYSFGYFDFNQAGFYWQFILGNLNYFGTAVSAEREFAFYRSANRSIRIQTLNLDDQQFNALHQSLEQAITPFPRYYAYDYFDANCSTWLRDLLDQTLDGALSKELKTIPAEDTLRSHVQQQSAHSPWASFGLMFLLGPKADRDISAWEEAFLPAVLAEQVATIQINNQPLVIDDFVYFEGLGVQSADVTLLGLPYLLILGLLLAAGLMLAAKRSVRSLQISHGIGCLVMGSLGAVLVFMSVFTGHDAVSENALLTTLHPLWFGLFAIWPAVIRKLSWWLSVFILGLGVALWAFGVDGRQDPAMGLFWLPIGLALLYQTRWSQVGPWVKDKGLSMPSAKVR